MTIEAYASITSRLAIMIPILTIIIMASAVVTTFIVQLGFMLLCKTKLCVSIIDNYIELSKVAKQYRSEIIEKVA